MSLDAIGRFRPLRPAGKIIVNLPMGRAAWLGSVGQTATPGADIVQALQTGMRVRVAARPAFAPAGWDRCWTGCMFAERPCIR